MKWTEEQVDELKRLCKRGLGNRAIAKQLGCNLTEVYAKRSQLGITIAKCKGIAPNPEFEKALEPIKSKGMTRDVKNAFNLLNDAVLFSMARDWTSMEDADEYVLLANELIALKTKYDARIGKVKTNEATLHTPT